MLEDRGGLGSQALVRAANALVDAANKDPDFAGVFTLFNAGSPSVYADIDRLKAEKVGLTPTDVFSTLQVYLGSQYVNDFNYLGRTYEVIVQANGQFRRTPQDITRLKVRNASGEMVPIGTVAQLRGQDGPLPSAALQSLSRRRGAGGRSAGCRCRDSTVARKSLLVRFFHGVSRLNGLILLINSDSVAPPPFSSSGQPPSSCFWSLSRSTKAGSCRWRSS